MEPPSGAENRYDAAVIGSGISGLAAAVFLAKAGKKVAVFEQAPITGGLLQSFSRNGAIFDTGAHYIGAMEPGQSLWKYFNYLDVADSFDLERLDPSGYDLYKFPDYDFRIPSGYDGLTEALISACHDDNPRVIREIINKIKDFCRLAHLDNPDSDFIRANLPFAGKSSLQALREWGATPVLCRNLLANSPLYGVSPTRCPFYIFALTLDGYTAGAWRFAGGSGKLAAALTDSLQRRGGEIYTKTRVDKIFSENRTASGIGLTNGKKIRSDFIISTAHPKTLCGLSIKGFSDSYKERITNLEDTPGVFSLYLQLNPSIMTANYNTHLYMEHDSSSIYDADRTEPSYIFYSISAGNNGNTLLQAMSFMPMQVVMPWEHTASGKRGEDYLKMKQQWEEKIISCIEKHVPGLKKAILHKNSATPLTFRDYTGSWNGSAYGIAKTIEQEGPRGIYHRSRIKNLLFAGQSAFMPGLYGSVISAVIAAGEILGLADLVNRINMES